MDEILTQNKSSFVVLTNSELARLSVEINELALSHYDQPMLCELRFQIKERLEQINKSGE